MKRLTKGLLTLAILTMSLSAFSQQVMSNKQFKREFLEDINHIRAKGCNCGTVYMPPAAPLTWNDQLEIASVVHSQDMANQNYFSHTSKDGRTMENRIAAVGYNYNGFKSYVIGENIAEGQLSIAEVMQGWIKSPGHCKNLMNPGFKEVGVATYNGYWVQDFGGREPFSEEQQKLIKSGKYKLIERN